MIDYIPPDKMADLDSYVRTETLAIPARHTRKRARYRYNRLVSLLNAAKTRVDIDPVGLYGIHSKTVNLGTCRHFDTAHKLHCTPRIVRVSDKMAFDADGTRYLLSKMICFTSDYIAIDT